MTNLDKSKVMKILKGFHDEEFGYEGAYQQLVESQGKYICPMCQSELDLKCPKCDEGRPIKFISVSCQSGIHGKCYSTCECGCHNESRGRNCRNCESEKSDPADPNSDCYEVPDTRNCDNWKPKDDPMSRPEPMAKKMGITGSD